MAFARVQTSTQATGTAPSSINITLSATTAGNLVVVHVKFSAQTSTVSSVTDSQGNTYVVQALVDSGTTNRLYQAYGLQVTGGVTTVTVNTTGNASCRCGADEFSGFTGAANADVFDTTNTGTGSTGTSLSVSTLTPAADGELIVATYTTTASKTWTQGANYTLSNGSGTTVQSQYRASGTTSETAPISVNSNAVWAGRATAFKSGGSLRGRGYVVGQAMNRASTY